MLPSKAPAGIARRLRGAPKFLGMYRASRRPRSAILAALGQKPVADRQ
jgi:hypothetical protein